MNKQATIAKLEAAIDAHGPTPPVDWTVEDQWDRILLVARWPDDYQDYEEWDPDTDWIQYADAAILKKAGIDHAKFGTDHPDNGYWYNWVQFDCKDEEEK